VNSQGRRTMTDDFAAFILTHGRPDNVRTYDTLRHHGYTGPIYLIVDNEDPVLNGYRSKFDHVVVFDKAAVAAETQWADNLPGHGGVILPARNACFAIARSLGVRYFVQLDDDYYDFYHRFDRNDVFRGKPVRNLDAAFAALLRFYRSTPFTAIALAQGGDFIGGGDSSHGTAIRLSRKAMNSFLCSTDRPFRFVGRVNEDVNTYVSLGSQGVLFGTANQLALDQIQTQTSAGGMSDVYRQRGTYAKSFYPVLFNPSSVRVSVMSTKYPRIHHRIDWNATAPKIVHASHKKGAD
jgi:hypothetical protein